MFNRRAKAAAVAVLTAIAGRAPARRDQPPPVRHGPPPAATGIEPITSGCNTDYDIQGYCAASGPYSLPDGIGTVATAARFVPALAGVASGDR